MYLQFLISPKHTTPTTHRVCQAHGNAVPESTLYEGTVHKPRMHSRHSSKEAQSKKQGCAEGAEALGLEEGHESHARGHEPCVHDARGGESVWEGGEESREQEERERGTEMGDYVCMLGGKVHADGPFLRGPVAKARHEVRGGGEDCAEIMLRYAIEAFSTREKSASCRVLLEVNHLEKAIRTAFRR